MAVLVSATAAGSSSATTANCRQNTVQSTCDWRISGSSSSHSGITVPSPAAALKPIFARHTASTAALILSAASRTAAFTSSLFNSGSRLSASVW
jgi:hypothetical protein